MKTIWPYIIGIIFLILISGCKSNKFLCEQSDYVESSVEGIVQKRKYRTYDVNLKGDSVIILFESTKHVEFNVTRFVDTLSSEETITWVDSLKGTVTLEKHFDKLKIHITDDSTTISCCILSQEKFQLVRVFYFNQKLWINFRNSKVIIE